MTDLTQTTTEPKDRVIPVSHRLLVFFWSLCLAGAAVGLIYLTFTRETHMLNALSDTVLVGVVLFIMAFVAEYVDSSLGMGYGTSLTPVLLILGFSPLQIVPAVLFSEFLSGVTAGGLHHKIGNVNLSWKTRAGKIMLIMTACSIVGTVVAVAVALALPKHLVKLYIGVMIVCIGVFILIGNRFMGSFSWIKIIVLGTIAAFNKGISGGGYGPLVTGGQVIVGVPGKKAIGITSLAEGLVCLVGLVLYVSFHGWFDWSLALPLTLGAMVSVPAATWTVKLLPERALRRSIGYATLFLGGLTLIKLVL